MVHPAKAYLPSDWEAPRALNGDHQAKHGRLDSDQRPAHEIGIFDPERADFCSSDPCLTLRCP